MRKFRVRAGTPKARYFTFFKGLCRKEQKGPVTDRDRRSDEPVFERGCARASAAAATSTMDMLVAMRKESRCACNCCVCLL